MNQTIETILNRRSYRAYQSKQITSDELSAILDCGLNAPSAMNSQSWHFTVIQNKGVIDWMNTQIKELLPQPAKERMIARNDGKEDFSVFYNAPTVFIVSGLKDDNYSTINCGLATQNMCLAAESLGVGSCIIGFAAFLFNAPQSEQYIRELGISEEYKPLYAVCFGYKNMQAQRPDRVENKVNIIA